MEGFYIFLCVLAFIVIVFISYLFGRILQDIAYKKGYREKYWFWFGFFSWWFGIIVLLIVSLMPLNKSQISSTNANFITKDWVPKDNDTEIHNKVTKKAPETTNECNNPNQTATLNKHSKYLLQVVRFNEDGCENVKVTASANSRYNNLINKTDFFLSSKSTHIAIFAPDYKSWSDEIQIEKDTIMYVNVKSDNTFNVTYKDTTI